MMKPMVKISEVVEYIDMASLGTYTFYNELTGEFYFYSDFDDRDDRDLDEEEGWLRLPSQRDADEYGMMTDFTYTVKKPYKREQLEIALSGRGAFRRFKDAVDREGVADAWYAFRDRRYLEFAREWCDEEEIPYDPAELPAGDSEEETQTGIYIGKTATVTTTVTEQNTAKSVGSGSLDVFATPMMIALMEQAACEVLSGVLEEGQTSVGTLINVEHKSASPLGSVITATASIDGISGRSIEFSVTAKDGDTEIGEGVHVRAIVDGKRFMDKLRKQECER
jgi:predicted thioesterase